MICGSYNQLEAFWRSKNPKYVCFLLLKVDKLKVRKSHKISDTPENAAGKYRAFYTAMYPLGPPRPW